MDVLSAQPSPQAQQTQRPPDETTQLHHQLIAENAVLLQDLGVLVRDKAELKVSTTWNESYQHIRSFPGTFNASEPSDGQAKPDQRPVYAYVKYDTKYVK